jgi:hypothetical protein
MVVSVHLFGFLSSSCFRVNELVDFWDKTGLDPGREINVVTCVTSL